MRARTVVLLTVVSIALVAFSQTDAQAVLPDNTQRAQTCTCCNHDNSSGDSDKCCQKGCCKDGKCRMMADGTKGPKCPMMAKESESSSRKMCCSGDKCPMHANGGHASNCCCGHMIDQEKPGV